TAGIEAENGLPVPLNRNFRSQRPLIAFFNFLFQRIFESGDDLVDELNELGYVEHEPSVAAREDEDPAPLVELHVDLRENDGNEDASSRQTARERDGEQLAERIASLVGNELITSARSSDHTGRRRSLEYRDIALLFRAMTEVHIYESAFRRAGIPFVTVDGKGFYAREEITDFIQLLRFLDNRTDEVALAAVLRSPICGLSDNALLALRCAPVRPGVDERKAIHRRSGVRSFFSALQDHELIACIEDADRPAIDRSRTLMNELIGRAKRARISELLRFAAEATDYRIVAAATFDGAQRLANIDKLFTLAERFERSGAYLIRDFVRFVQDFEDAGGRESEGQIDESADVVRLMSIHQSKGLEFPVVIIPDLHRLPDNRREWWALDRHRGLTVKVPDGRGRLAAGNTFAEFTERAKKREDFESMRLLYVAATRAQDRLILSGAAKDLSSIGRSWLGWIAGALQTGKELESRMLDPTEGVQVRFTVNLLGAATPGSPRSRDLGARRPQPDPAQDLLAAGDYDFPLLKRIEPQRVTGLHRFSVTQLLNY
ncbi:MAG: 3'-5' exonuclease, partial [Actinomycetota bacterium]